jgi:uncharacterized protein (TIGR03067 family)
MSRHIGMVLVVGLMLAADAPKENDAKKETEKLQGSWRGVSMERGGEVEKERAPQFVLTFDKGQHILKLRDKVHAKGPFKIDPSKSPKTIDLTDTTADPSDPSGGKAWGIYELDGDTLKLCTLDGKRERRPKGFNTKGTDVTLVILKREKP